MSTPEEGKENKTLDHMDYVLNMDDAALRKAEKAYGDSWKKRGGVGAFMMLARKWDRLENQVKHEGYDIFDAVEADGGLGVKDGIIDDIRDLRRYLILVEAELIVRADGEPNKNVTDPNAADYEPKC